MSGVSANAYVFWTDPGGVLRRSPIGEEPVTVGAREECALSFAHATMGPVHAAIERHAGGCRVRCMSRVRPLMVNGDEVTTQELDSGDRITLGEIELIYVDAPEVAATGLNLTVRGPEDTPEVLVPLLGSVTVVGRVEGDVLIDDASISSRHLEIENFGDGRRWVRDLGSTNGSALNGEPLSGDRKPLAYGDKLTIGRIEASVANAGPPPEGTLGVTQRNVLFVDDRAHA